MPWKASKGLVLTTAGISQILSSYSLIEDYLFSPTTRTILGRFSKEEYLL